MSRPSRKVPAYGHHKASGQARVRLGGKDHYLGPYGLPPAGRSTTGSSPSGSPPAASLPAPKPDLTVTELIPLYKTHAESYYVKGGKPTSEVNNIRLALQPVRRLYGHTLLGTSARWP